MGLRPAAFHSQDFVGRDNRQHIAAEPADDRARQEELHLQYEIALVVINSGDNINSRVFADTTAGPAACQGFIIDEQGLPHGIPE